MCRPKRDVCGNLLRDVCRRGLLLVQATAAALTVAARATCGAAVCRTNPFNSKICLEAFSYEPLQAFTPRKLRGRNIPILDTVEGNSSGFVLHSWKWFFTGFLTKLA
jgi:hypothetical protein